MARYDPYDRGDNPLRLDLDVLDMPKRAADKVRPKVASKGAATPAKKKAKPVPTTGTTRKDPWAGRGPEATADILNREPGHDYATGKPLVPGYTLDPERFSTPLRTTGPEMTVTPDERNVPAPISNLPRLPDVPPPNITSGLLAPPPPGGPVVGGAGPAALTSTGGPTPVMQPGIMALLDRLDSWLPASWQRQGQ